MPRFSVATDPVTRSVVTLKKLSESAELRISARRHKWR